jgi:biopolymer transport protein ExbB/TolQ
MNYKHLLLLRYSLINSIGIIFFIVTYSQGYIDKAINADVTYVVILIITLFLLGLFIATQKTLWISRELNYAFSEKKVPTSLVNDFLQNSKGLDASSRSNLASSIRIKISSKIELVKFISNTLVVLGLIGTVIGFIIALSGVNSSVASNPDEIGKMVTSLIKGMSVALYTTLAGSILSVWLNICYQMLTNGANKLLSKIIEKGEKN